MKMERVQMEVNLPPTEFEQVTAEQLCLERNRDEPNEKDIEDAIKMTCKWNQKRIKMGLKSWQ
jgi:hypothetical protein